MLNNLFIFLYLLEVGMNNIENVEKYLLDL